MIGTRMSTRLQPIPITFSAQAVPVTLGLARVRFVRYLFVSGQNREGGYSFRICHLRDPTSRNHEDVVSRATVYGREGAIMQNQNLKLSKYSIGTGDRFAHQAKAQLHACVQAFSDGIEVIPVWNKSNREHTIIGSEPASVRQAAEAAVEALDWKLPYFCDADHIIEIP